MTVAVPQSCTDIPEDVQLLKCTGICIHDMQEYYFMDPVIYLKDIYCSAAPIEV